MQFVHLLLFYCFIHTCSRGVLLSSFFPREISSRILERSSIRGRLAFFATYLQLCRGYDPREGGEKIVRGSFRMQLERSRREEEASRGDHFLFINHRKLRSTRIPRIVSLRHGRYCSPTPPKHSCSSLSRNSREKGVLVEPNVSPFRVT